MDGLLYQAIEENEDHRCLYEGDSESMLGAVAPWLFQFHRNSDFVDLVVEHGAKNNWGVIVRSSIEEEELYRHLRKFLIVKQEDGKELYFRFYDPRVLREFLPTCSADQLKDLFGPLEAYIMENDEGMVIKFQLQNGKLSRYDLKVDLETYLKRPDKIEEKLQTHAVHPEKKEKKDERWNFGF
jgi:hypothetical protein